MSVIQQNRVFMCTCCPAVLHESELITDNYGEMACPISGTYVPSRTWNDAWRTKRRFTYVDDKDFGFCEECGNDYHPHAWLIDDFGSAVCKNDATLLVSFDSDTEYY